MQDIDSDAWLSDGKLFFDDEDLADLPLLLSDDGVTDSSDQNPQTVIANPTGSDAPSSGLLRGQEPAHNEYEKCLETLLEIFPAISLEYVRELYNVWMQTPRSSASRNQVLHAFEDITLQLLETKSIPREKDRTNDLKRKRPSALDSGKENMSQRNSSQKEHKTARYMNAAYVSIFSLKSLSFAIICWSRLFFSSALLYLHRQWRFSIKSFQALR